jgi:sRNA-binding regulator protein Hfq
VGPVGHGLGMAGKIKGFDGFYILIIGKTGGFSAIVK